MALKPLHPDNAGAPASGEVLSPGVWRIGSAPAQEVDTDDLKKLGPAALIQLLRRTLRQAESSERSYRSLLDAVPDAVTVFDRRGRVVDANAAACISFGLSHKALCRMSVFDLNPTLPADHMRRVWGQLQLGKTFVDRVFNRRADGKRFPVDVHSNAYLDRGRARIVAIARDISAQLAAEEALTERATHDALTLLPNRHAMLESLEAAIARGVPFALLSIDLDRFKIVNDFLGHAGGDRLLSAAAQRMRRCCKNQELLVRYGGDEFIISMALPEDCAQGERAMARLTARLTRAFARPFRLQGQEFSVTLSI
ncbi:MAG: diguanylate cyclase, partial [Lysobacterales bacterium]